MHVHAGLTHMHPFFTGVLRHCFTTMRECITTKSRADCQQQQQRQETVCASFVELVCQARAGITLPPRGQLACRATCPGARQASAPDKLDEARPPRIGAQRLYLHRDRALHALALAAPGTHRQPPPPGPNCASGNGGQRRLTESKPGARLQTCLGMVTKRASRRTRLVRGEPARAGMHCLTCHRMHIPAARALPGMPHARPLRSGAVTWAAHVQRGSARDASAAHRRNCSSVGMWTPARPPTCTACSCASKSSCDPGTISHRQPITGQSPERGEALRHLVGYLHW